MRIAICAPFMEADLLEQRIRSAVPTEEFIIDEYNSMEALLALPGLSLYEAVWIFFPGSAGIDAVRRARARHPDIPVVWMGDQAEFVKLGLPLHLSMFLLPNSTNDDFRTAVENSKKRRKHIC